MPFHSLLAQQGELHLSEKWDEQVLPHFILSTYSVWKSLNLFVMTKSQWWYYSLLPRVHKSKLLDHLAISLTAIQKRWFTCVTQGLSIHLRNAVYRQVSPKTNKVKFERFRWFYDQLQVCFEAWGLSKLGLYPESNLSGKTDVSAVIGEQSPVNNFDQIKQV